MTLPENLLSIGCLPLWVGCGLLALAAVVNHVHGRVPNLLSLGALGAGWLTAFVLAVPDPPVGGGIGSSLLCSGVALAMLIGLYRMGLGAGCVKVQMAFAAWVGCGLDWQPAVIVTIAATLLGTLLTLAGWRFYVRQQAVAAEFGQRRAGMFPAQWTLSLGSIAGLILLLALIGRA